MAVILKGNRGAIAIFVAICFVVFLCLLALVIDIGYGLITRNEVQNVADGAALAGARRLGEIYKKGCKFTPDYTSVYAIVRDVASKNKAAGLPILEFTDDDIQIGYWSNGTFTILPPPPDYTGCHCHDPKPDAVRVVARRDTRANTPISTFFAGIFSINAININADAIAALTDYGGCGCCGKVIIPKLVK